MTILETQDALGLANLIKQKELTPKELLDLTIQKAEQLNPSLNFLSQKFYDYGYTQIKEGLPQGKFHGVPFLLKNLGAACIDTPLSLGSRLFADYVCDYNDEVVNRYKKAGLVFFGRSAACEFGMSFTTESLAHGRTHNPWNLALTTGGSSGGAAAAVAARIIPMADASDGGGSIRVPASCCGIFGLKPTRARVPAGPMVGENWNGLGTNHVLTLSVRDSAAMLDSLAGSAVGDPYHAPLAPASYLQALETPVRKLKIGFLDSLAPNENVDVDVKNHFEKSLSLLTSLGHELIPVSFPTDIKIMRKSFITIAVANLLSFLQQIEKQRGFNIAAAEIEPIQGQFVEYAKTLSAADFAAAIYSIQFHSRKIATWFENFDVLLTPCTAKIARPLGELVGEHTDLGHFNALQLAFSPFTSLANMTGQPAMSVPLFWTENNVPLGTHFIGRFGDELTLFQLARQLELDTPWFGKRPASHII